MPVGPSVHWGGGCDVPGGGGGGSFDPPPPSGGPLGEPPPPDGGVTVPLPGREVVAMAPALATRLVHASSFLNAGNGLPARVARLVSKTASRRVGWTIRKCSISFTRELRCAIVKACTRYLPRFDSGILRLPERR